MGTSAILVVVATLLFLIGDAHGFVIAPPWANPAVNPCSEKSWQLIYWPDDGKCYRIFEQGPCPDSQELAYHSTNGRAICRCPKNLLYWAATDRCYPKHSRGPCEINQYVELEDGSDSNGNNRVVCKQTKICENGWIFWPPMQDCFQLYTQGPCHKGDLLIVNPLTAEPYCGCDPLLLRQYYFPPLKLCYEHLTRGPCEAGLLFAYNHTSDATHCLCSESLVNYHEATGQCFQFGTKGPCRNGQTFQLNPTLERGECRCRQGYVFWPRNGECYKAFTAGPCASEQFLIPHKRNANLGQCVDNPCPRAHLYFPTRTDPVSGADSIMNKDTEVKCHKVGSRGPCPLGQLVVFEKYSGKSYRGECGCSPGYNQNYWPETDQCFEWYTQGPCKDSFLFQYNRDQGHTECVCDEQDGFVYWNETQKCYRVYSQGPCPENAWLIPAGDLTEVFCECRHGYHFSSSQYACLPTSLLSPLGDRGSGGGHPLQLFPYMKNHKLFGAGGNLDDYDEDDLENSTDHPTGGLHWSRGVFVTPGSDVIKDTSRIDDGDDPGTGSRSKFNWLKQRHKWEWWQRPRQPRQPSWANSGSRRRRRRRRRLVHSPTS